jgi:hypothetical protein
MYLQKNQVKGSTAGLKNIFLLLLMIGQQQKLELPPLFSNESCTVLSSLIDGHIRLCKANKSALVKQLAVL